MIQPAKNPTNISNRSFSCERRTTQRLLRRATRRARLKLQDGRWKCGSGRLTHAGDDAVDRQASEAMVDGLVHASAVPPGAAPRRLPLAADERRVLLLGDVDVEAGVGGAHDVARARVQHDVGGVQPPHSDQTHAVPASATDGRHGQTEARGGPGPYGSKYRWQ